MKKYLVGGAALGLALAASAALSQINVVPSPGLTTNYLAKATYSAAFFGLVPVVTAGTDQICISGSATKVVRLQRLTLWGTTTTAIQTMPVNLVRRVSADTGGTAATTTANPANTIAKRDVGTGTASATVVSYTAAPTIVDSSPTYIDSQIIVMPLGLVTNQPAGVVDFHYSRDFENLVQVPTLVGAAAQICINNPSTITNASVWNGMILWTEE